MKHSLLNLTNALLIFTSIYFIPPSTANASSESKQTSAISIGAEFASGKYGTDTATRSVYIPLIVSWMPTERIDTSIEVPFLYQNNDNVTTELFRNSQQGSVAGKQTAKRGYGNSGSGLLQTGSGGPGGVAGGTTVSGDSSSTVTGVGDIIYRMGFIALFEGDNSPQIRPSISVKFPTASSSNGLGTGKFDGGAGIELTKWFGDLHLVCEGMYNLQGKVDGFGLKDYVSYTVGAGYKLTETLEPMLIVKGATAPSDYSSELLETRVRLLWSLSGSAAVDLFVSNGIADSSPDYRGGLAVIYSF